MRRHRPTRAGWVVGAGIEYLLQPNLTLNLGYQYIDLGTVNLASSAMDGWFFNYQQTASAHAAFQCGHAWFELAVLSDVKTAMPWEGPYVGGHAGGAWGLQHGRQLLLQLFAPTSDIRLKRDIALVGRRDDGLGLYRYRYLWSDTVYVGAMAQEVALVHPDAVVRNGLNDYLRVDYGRLGLHLMTLPEWDARSKGERL